MESTLASFRVSEAAPNIRVRQRRPRRLQQGTATRMQVLCLAVISCWGLVVYLNGFYREYQLQQRVLELDGVVCVEPTGHSRPTADQLTLFRYVRGYRIVAVSFAQNSDIGDDDIAPLRYLRSLDTVLLSGTSISGNSLEMLGQISTLKQLDISMTDVDDSCLESLVGLPELERLSLNRTRVSDHGLSLLRSIEPLRHLNIVGTSTTKEGIRRLRNAIPELKVATSPAFRRLGGDLAFSWNGLMRTLDLPHVFKE